MPGRTAHPLQALLFGLLLVVLLTNVLTTSFERLGLSPRVVSLVIGGSLLGSFVNIPVWIRRRTLGPRVVQLLPGFVIFRAAPQTIHQVVAVNLGGALVPLAVSAWLLPEAAWWKVAAGTVVVALAVHRLARVRPGVGIETPALVPPLVAGMVGWLLAGLGGPEAAPIAYIAGTAGTLVGADLMNLRQVTSRDSTGGILSIGGAGVFDGVFLVGIVAAFLV